MTDWPLESECIAFYGDPRGRDGKVNPKWEAEHIIQIRAPYPMTYGGKPITLLRTHKRCSDALRAALVDAWARVGGDLKRATALGMTLYGGGYNYRLKRTNNELSMHAFGCAWDFDVAHNPLGRRTGNSFSLDHPLVQAFLNQNATWGGSFRSTADFQHMQFARVR